MEILPGEPSSSMRDTTKLTEAFLNFANEPKKYLAFLQLLPNGFSKSEQKRSELCRKISLFVRSSVFVMQRLFLAINEYSTLPTTPLTPHSPSGVLSVRNVEEATTNTSVSVTVLS